MRIVAVSAVFALLAGVSGSQSAPAFVPAPAGPIVVGPGSGTVLVEDLNRDGHLDLLTRHLLTRTFTVALGREGGTFGPAASFTVQSHPADARVADINGDRLLDLVLTANTTDVVEVLAGDGSGRFSPIAGSPYTVSAAAELLNKRTLHLVDINEDGHLDVATANGRRVNTMSVLFGDGRGRFSAGPRVTLESGRDRYWYAFGDVSGDAHLDLVIASAGADAEGSRGRLLVQIGDGHGGFQPAAPPVSIRGAGPVSLADVDGDGRLDAGIAHADGTISIHSNRGNARLIADADFRVGLGSQGHALVLRDVNGDSRRDIVAATGDSVVILLRTPTGYAPAPGSPFRAGPGAFSVTVADVNKDGKLDLAAPSFEGEAVTIWLGR